MNSLSVKRKILHIGVYSDPEPIGGNNLLWTQAHELSQLHYNVEIVTYPRKGAWTGNFPLENQDLFNQVPTLSYYRRDILYHVISPPQRWGYHVSSNEDWKVSVEWAKSLISNINPLIVHQHYWQNTWYFMEAALQLGIPTVYTSYDWGLPCRRQFLVTGNGNPCISIPSRSTCFNCCSSGSFFDKSQTMRDECNLPLSYELDQLFGRWEKISKRLNALIVKSPFAKKFYSIAGIDNSIIHMMPWFYNQPLNRSLDKIGKSKNRKIGFIGRLVPEKGLHLLLEALAQLQDLFVLDLEIAGLSNNIYSQSLEKKYGKKAGKHNINWIGWIENRQLGTFFENIDILVVPSLWYDNTPTVIAESLAHGCPVICTDLPSMTYLVHHRENGFVFKLNDSKALAACITEFFNDDILAARLFAQASYSIDPKHYAEFLSQIYKQVISEGQ